MFRKLKALFTSRRNVAEPLPIYRPTRFQPVVKKDPYSGSDTDSLTDNSELDDDDDASAAAASTTGEMAEHHELTIPANTEAAHSLMSLETPSESLPDEETTLEETAAASRQQSHESEAAEDTNEQGEIASSVTSKLSTESDFTAEPSSASEHETEVVPVPSDQDTETKASDENVSIEGDVEIEHLASQTTEEPQTQENKIDPPSVEETDQDHAQPAKVATGPISLVPQIPPHQPITVSKAAAPLPFPQAPSAKEVSSPFPPAPPAVMPTPPPRPSAPNMLSPTPMGLTPEQLCGITPNMTPEQIRQRLAVLYRRYNFAAASLNAGLRAEAQTALNAIVAVREKYFGPV